MPDSSARDRFTQALRAGAAQLGISLAREQEAAYQTHYALLLSHNPRAGLTTITDPVEAAVKHFLDSLAGLLLRDIAPGERVADIGSGGGFPGAALAVARPGAEFTLIESVGKRARFLTLVVERLGLDNVVVLHDRAEAAGRAAGHREKYDLVVARAVAPLPRLLKYALPLLRPGGRLLAYRGRPESGTDAPPLPAKGRRARLLSTLPLELPQGMGRRTLLLIGKEA